MKIPNEVYLIGGGLALFYILNKTKQLTGFNIGQEIGQGLGSGTIDVLTGAISGATDTAGAAINSVVSPIFDKAGEVGYSTGLGIRNAIQENIIATTEQQKVWNENNIFNLASKALNQNNNTIVNAAPVQTQPVILNPSALTTQGTYQNPFVNPTCQSVSAPTFKPITQSVAPVTFSAQAQTPIIQTVKPSFTTWAAANSSLAAGYVKGTNEYYTALQNQYNQIYK